ncbi:hypothetical protein F4778DRAFT_302975 [Xylariomycetidae sp. FL2044]|nr:hypothetical protein F4778DRAFT_302975 [Xylariomycetidae sp. FL2044]
MKGRPVDQLVYEAIYNKPLRPNDPQSFQALLHRHLILEVRQEVHSFYGHLNTQEAKYPGLDYTNPIHRIRLSRWEFHRRLFAAFDRLRLTHTEIASLTKWEGTKWAKDRFERDSGIVIQDTAGRGIPDWIEPEDRPTATRTTIRGEPEDVDEEDPADSADEDMDGEEETDDEELDSIGFALHEQLRERAARREAGDTSEPLDEEWEQWLKNAIDSGQLPFLTDQLVHQSTDASPLPQSFFPAGMMTAARSGNWEEIPEFLHPLLRRSLETETPRRQSFSRRPAATRLSSDTIQNTIRQNMMARAWRRRTYANLRLPSDGANGASERERRHPPNG